MTIYVATFDKPRTNIWELDLDKQTFSYLGCSYKNICEQFTRNELEYGLNIPIDSLQTAEFISSDEQSITLYIDSLDKKLTFK